MRTKLCIPRSRKSSPHLQYVVIICCRGMTRMGWMTWSLASSWEPTTAVAAGDPWWGAPSSTPWAFPGLEQFSLQPLQRKGLR